jgi:tetratricopeptide (TPR) repeat protein
VETGTSANLECPAFRVPMLWTSTATGVPPDAHGISFTVEVRPDRGGVQPVSAPSWQAPPVWEILATAGIPTIVVGWPASWPAETWPGIAVDERFAQPTISLRQDWPLPPHCVTPPRLRTILRGLRVHPLELDSSEARGSLPAPSLAADASIHAAATYLAEREPWQFLAVHYGLLVQDNSDDAYRFQDAMLGRLLGLAGPEADAIVVSPQGALIAAGPGFATDTIAHGTGMTDIMPTVLARFGLVAESAAGRVLEGTRHEKLRPVALARSPRAPSADNGPPPAPAAARLIADVQRATVLNRASAALAAGDHTTAASILECELARCPDDLDVCFLLGQCRFFLGDWQGCLTLGRRLAEGWRDRPWGEMMIGAALALGGDNEAAMPHLDAAARLAGADPAAHIRLGAIALHLARAREAQAHYQNALAIDPSAADAQAGLGLALLAQSDLAKAEAQLRAALGLRFHAPAVHYQLGVILAGEQRWPEAAAALRTALAQHAGLTQASKLLREVEARMRGES